MQHDKLRASTDPTRDEALELFRYVRAELKLRQREIARATGIDQGSISKIMRGAFVRLAPTSNAYRVWKYAREKAKEAGFRSRKPVAEVLEPRLKAKLAQVWDKTPEGASALLKLLDAADLIRKRSFVRRSGGGKD